MSVEAITWALRQPIPQSSAKFLLVVLANCADGRHFTCWPSVAYLEAATSQNRKTVLANLKRLKAAGLIADTGERRGTSARIVVYRLGADQATIDEVDDETGFGTVPKTATIPETDEGQDQKRTADGTENGGQTGPETGHGTVRNRQRKVREPSQAEQVAALPLPDYLPSALWQQWIEHRRAIGKPLTVYAAQGNLRTLAGLVDDGHDASVVVHEAIDRCWQQFYAPKRGASASPKKLRVCL